MQEKDSHAEEPDKTFAAVCGLYCRSCRWFIGTTEDPQMLRRLAAERHYTEEEARCYGCRSAKRLVYCRDCKMSACAAERGIDFCSQCGEFPCAELKQFQAAMPHRSDLWANLERIRSAGYRQWLEEIRQDYLCPRCRCLNATYDLKCRKCGHEPSCSHVARHKEEIERFFGNR